MSLAATPAHIADTPIAGAHIADAPIADAAPIAEFGLSERAKIERGLQEFNERLRSNPIGAYIEEIKRRIAHTYSDHAFIDVSSSNPESFSFSEPAAVVFYCNPSISGLSDFAPHYNLFVFTIFDDPTNVSKGMDATHAFFIEVIAGQLAGKWFKMKPVFTGPRISLQLHIGDVFNIPVLTVHMMNSVFETSHLSGAPGPIEPQPFTYNAKQIGPYNRLDLVIELLTGVPEDDPYAQVNPLIARGMNAVCVNRFGAENPNTVIQQVCSEFNELILPTAAAIRSKIIKHALIAIVQNPAVQTSDNRKFSDIFPSGQYASYFDEIAYRCDTRHATGALMDPAGVPLTRTGIIVAALTAVNAAMKVANRGHIVAGGGAAVSYYIQDFITDAHAISEDVVRTSGLENVAELVDRCKKIPMNDIDCFVFGEGVSRPFLLMLSLYMMILYENFYERPKRYHKLGALETQVKKFRFMLSASSDDHIDLFMYGNRKNDANTKLISKRLKKNPKVQLVTQETKCFSQIVHPVCQDQDQGQDLCKEDDYYMQPIDLVKKDVQEFVELYLISLYQPDQILPPEDLDSMVQRQYTSDNMVSLKTTMLDIICIFCDEGKSLFIRIFMARKNPKDFSRLRVFIDLYLLQLLRSKQSSPEAFAAVDAGFIAAVGNLRQKMDQLNAAYYLEQGNIAAIQVETAEQIYADRAEFLKMLREIGRRVVALPDPFDDRVPVAFQSATTGDSTIYFFRRSRTMKYRFNMRRHMTQLVSMYKSPAPLPADHYKWLDGVFTRIKFAPSTEEFFRSVLEKVLNTAKNNPDGNHEIGFKNMPVRSSLMLRLHDALRAVNPRESVFKRFSILFGNLLRPVQYHVAKYQTLPTAHYVGISDGMYDLDQKQQLFPVLVKDVILLSEANENPERVELLNLIDELNVGKKNTYARYDDAVKEEIGRIILDYAREFIGRLKGGGNRIRKTRKRARVRRVKTRGHGHERGHERSVSKGVNTRKRKLRRRHRLTRRLK